MKVCERKEGGVGLCIFLICCCMTDTLVVSSWRKHTLSDGVCGSETRQSPAGSSAQSPQGPIWVSAQLLSQLRLSWEGSGPDSHSLADAFLAAAGLGAVACAGCRSEAPADPRSPAVLLNVAMFLWASQHGAYVITPAKIVSADKTESCKTSRDRGSDIHHLHHIPMVKGQVTGSCPHSEEGIIPRTKHQEVGSWGTCESVLRGQFSGSEINAEVLNS